MSIQGTTSDADPLLWTGMCTTADPLARRAERTTVRVGLLDGMPAEVIGSPSQGILFATSALTRMCACKSWMSESGVGRMHGMWMGSQVKECQTSRMHGSHPVEVHRITHTFTSTILRQRPKLRPDPDHTSQRKLRHRAIAKN